MQYTFLKSCTTIQFAHLYEHIFYAHFNSSLRKQGLYQPLDYDLDGITYGGGIIAITLTVYSPQLFPRNIPSLFKSFAIEFTVNTLKIAANQIVAEKQKVFDTPDIPLLQKKLKELHEQPWESIEVFTQYDTEGMTRSERYFYEIDQKLPKHATRKFTSSINLDKKFASQSRHLLPLFRQLGWLIQHNHSLDLADERGYFIASEALTMPEPTKLATIFYCGIAEMDATTTNKALHYYQELIRKLFQDKAIDRFINNYLRAISYKDRPTEAPSIQRNYEDTAIFIGTEGWREIATTKNIELLLKNMFAEIEFKRVKTVAKLSVG